MAGNFTIERRRKCRTHDYENAGKIRKEEHKAFIQELNRKVTTDPNTKVS